MGYLAKKTFKEKIDDKTITLIDVSFPHVLGSFTSSCGHYTSLCTEYLLCYSKG